MFGDGIKLYAGFIDDLWLMLMTVNSHFIFPKSCG
jgi:hypothetical protein